VTDRAEHAALLRRATNASVLIATFLIAIKLAAWLSTGSVAVLSALIDSILDLVASLATLFAVRHALSPADSEHRFGHGKAEAIAGLAQATFIAGSSTLLLIEAARRFIRPVPIENTGIGLVVISVAIVATVVLVALQRHVVRRTGSLAIAGDSLHYAGDLLTNLGVIVSLLVSAWFGWVYADPVFGAAIALFLYYNAWIIGRRALGMLMDHELSDTDREKILAIALNHPEVSDVHELRTRESGPNRFIQFHLEMDGSMTLRRAHEIADEVEAELLTAFPAAEIIIHQDPAGLEENHPQLVPD
jgi:ferrous-iron efflux pump FieF